MGGGDGTFGAATTYETESGTTSTGAYGLATGDLNHDGFADYVIAGENSAGVGYAQIRLGRGVGTFGAALSYATESLYSQGVVLGDLNGDKILDLITAGYANTGSFDGYATVRMGRGDGSFGAARSYATEAYGSTSVAIGDINGDGIVDLVTAGSDDSFTGWATVRFGTGSGTFGSARSYATNENGSAV